MAAASTRFATPSLPRMFETWTLAVLRVMNRASAICWFDRPAATSRMTSASRSRQAESAPGSSSAPRVRGARASIRAWRARRSISRRSGSRRGVPSVRAPRAALQRPSPRSPCGREQRFRRSEPGVGGRRRPAERLPRPWRCDPRLPGLTCRGSGRARHDRDRQAPHDGDPRRSRRLPCRPSAPWRSADVLSIVRDRRRVVASAGRDGGLGLATERVPGEPPERRVRAGCRSVETRECRVGRPGSDRRRACPATPSSSARRRCQRAPYRPGPAPASTSAPACRRCSSAASKSAPVGVDPRAIDVQPDRRGPTGSRLKPLVGSCGCLVPTSQVEQRLGDVPQQGAAVRPGDPESLGDGVSLASGRQRRLGPPDAIEQRREVRVTERDPFDATEPLGDRQVLRDTWRSRARRPRSPPPPSRGCRDRAPPRTERRPFAPRAMLDRLRASTGGVASPNNRSPAAWPSARARSADGGSAGMSRSASTTAGPRRRGRPTPTGTSAVGRGGAPSRAGSGRPAATSASSAVDDRRLTELDGASVRPRQHGALGCPPQDGGVGRGRVRRSSSASHSAKAPFVVAPRLDERVDALGCLAGPDQGRDRRARVACRDPVVRELAGRDRHAADLAASLELGPERCVEPLALAVEQLGRRRPRPAGRDGRRSHRADRRCQSAS